MSIALSCGDSSSVLAIIEGREQSKLGFTIIQIHLTKPKDSLRETKASQLLLH